MLKKIKDWLVYSSANPDKYSLTIKGVAGYVASIVVMAIAVFFSVTVATTEITPLVDMFADLTTQFFIVVAEITKMLTLAVAFFGAVRKIWYTIKPKTVAS